MTEYHRAGPPTPRNEPYHRPSHAEGALTFGHGDHPGAYDGRNEAWAAFRSRMQMFWTPMLEAAEKDGFFSGWDARRQFDLAQNKSVDSPTPPVATDAEGDRR